MKLGSTALRRSICGSGLIVALSTLAAYGGPARYDKDAKSFRFTYTFATLPGGAGQGAATTGALVGSVQKASAAQEATVNDLLGRVSDTLFRATAGRGKIGKLDYVDDIKNADIVVSMTGQPLSPGWAIRNAIDGRPGQIVLYYQSLVLKIEQDVVYTIAHEMCHYIFDLTDEYIPSNFPRGCPPHTGPGCLMDNYNSGARGYMGRFCASDHDGEPNQPLSCQAIVDKFFTDRGVSIDPKAAPNPAADPRVPLVESALGQVRAKRQADVDAGKGSSSLRTFAQNTLKTLIDQFNRQNPNKVTFGAGQITKAIEQIVVASGIIPIEKPAGLVDLAFNLIKAEADRLGKDAEGKGTLASRASKVKTGLRSFIQALRKDGQIEKADLAPTDQAKLIDRLATDVARDPKDKQFDRIAGLGEITVRLDRAIAEDIITLLDEGNVQGTAVRRRFLADIDRELKRYSIPGRTSDRFGLRRTRLITPDPIDPSNNFVLTEAGIFSYSLIRDRSIVQFARLVDRARIEVVTPTLRAESGVGSQALNMRIDRPFGSTVPETPSGDVDPEEPSLRAVLKDTVDSLGRNRLENIVILVPPGGLPKSLTEDLRAIDAQLPADIDVRVDVILVGPTSIPDSLRNFVVKSRGSILTVTDIDEVGSIAQRLKNEQSTGSWVVIPQQGKIPAIPEPGNIPAPPAVVKIDVEIDDLSKWVANHEANFKTLLGSLEAAKGLAIAESAKRGIEEAKTNASLLQISLKGVDEEFQKLKSTSVQNPRSNEEKRKVDSDIRTLVGTANLQLSRARVDLDKVVKLSVSNPNKVPLEKVKTDIEGPGALDKNFGSIAKTLVGYEAVYRSVLEKTFEYQPIYKRVDRDNLDSIRIGLEKAQSGIAPGPANVPELRLAQFYAEEQGEFELIVGLSRELPRDLPPDKDGNPFHPRLSLRSPANLQGVLVPAETIVKFDQDDSTATLLVYRNRKPDFLAPGWYVPVLELGKDCYEKMAKSGVNFTFSVGSARPNVQLIAGLAQDLTNETLGTLKSTTKPAVIEAQVSAGSSVLNATVFGLAQRISIGAGPIVPEPVSFVDNGIVPDRVADDGIYTGQISLAGVVNPTEFRVFIQADTVVGDPRLPADRQVATYIKLEDPNALDGRKTAADRKSKDPVVEAIQAAAQKAAEGQVEKFQRATSVHFVVKP